MKKYALVFLIGIILVLGLLTFQSSKGSRLSSNNESKDHSLRVSAASLKEFHSTISIAAIGDLLIHRPVYEDAKKQDGVYDFSPMLTNVKDTLRQADFTMANQESIIGGTEIGLSTYPSFNSPFEVADNFQDAGVDLMTMANNHTLDRGETAIQNAIAHYEKIGMHYVGSYKDMKDAETLRIINVKGMNLGFLSYTYGTNGIPVPKGKPHLVSLIDKEKIKKDLERLKNKVDVVIVNMHWGLEYQSYPSTEQKELAQFIANEGAHVIIGHHPHVLQPMEWIEQENGDKSIVVYSLGNFLSAQKGNGKDIGGIFQLQIDKKTDGNVTAISLRNPKVIPTFVSSHGSRNYKIHFLKDMNEQKNNEVIEHMNQWLKTKEATFIQESETIER
ncbi:CapA family protein [Bacillus sp. FJAT-47783]|uniref:CapA family protein n=1 Tax=Bacillus sp. FJAT-47783 TaxID=2922712 RepID=UPI001FAE2704|nr:CapA family protein [Bacillus sp. FJAT-47783]